VTDAQQEILRGYIDEPTCEIRTIEYPSGLSIPTETGTRAVFDLIKILHHTQIHERSEKRGYVDWYDKYGDRKKTDYLGVIDDDE
jgi:hypothetical protein